jgi:hypothetical protein
LKLAGVVQRSEGPRAALVIEGEVVLVPAGGSAFGYTVLSIDDDAGVRVRTPEGEERTLVGESR